MHLYASWDVSGLLSLRSVLQQPEISRRLAQHDAHLLLADFTNYNEEIANLLDELQLGSVPQTVLFFPDERPPHIFPALLRRESFLTTIDRLLAK